jgi:putative nucleotidyltransferase with HDIG domain
VRKVQSKPLFGSFWLASLVNLATAVLLTGICFLDVLISPVGEWRDGQPAPTTYRSPTMYSAVSEELLSVLDKDDSVSRSDRFLIKRGETVSEADLVQLKRLLPERMHLDLRRAGGVLLFFFLALTFFNLLLRRQGRLLLLRFRAVTTLYLFLILASLASRLMLSYTTLSLYALPVALAAILFSPLVSQNIGFTIHLLSLTIIAPMFSFTPGMVLIPLVSGWTAVLLLKRETGPVRFLVASIAGALAGCLFLSGLDLFTPQHIDFGPNVESDLLGLAGGTLACGVAAVLFSFPVTLMFGSVPRSMLRKLLDLDHPVLRDLAEKAPGTFQHSLAVANMAEKVADSIGADDELVRAGAYYHDIGKMHQPEYFIENQQGENPHDKIAPESSAEKLRAHMDHGITIARGADLPERLVDFIVEHHGSSTMEYFLDKAYQIDQKTIEPDQFQYQGRNPTSKETAILMIVDAVEAASRTLKKPGHDEIENLVRRIIFSKMLHGYLDQSGLTTRDLKRIGISLIKFLQGQYHVRVEYPWQKKLAERPPLLVVPDTHAGLPRISQPVRVAQPVIETPENAAAEKTDKDG